MAGKLRLLGLTLLVATALLLVAGEAGAVPAALVDPLVRPGLLAGAVCLVGGILMAAVTPLGRMTRRGRCVRCGSPTERGQTYCLDHLQQAVNEYRDQARDGMGRR